MKSIKMIFKPYTAKRTLWEWFTRKPKVIIKPELFTYEPGTIILKETYTDNTKEIMNTNPIILDLEGKTEFWIE